MTLAVSTNFSSEPKKQSYKFVFVVKATSWDDVADIFKQELGITQKRNESDREISGLYLVSCDLKQSKLTKSFYEKVEKSSKLAIHADEKSNSLYPKILEETQIVEEHLRRLLLHVSDAVEGFIEILGYKDREVVEANALDPITSKLSFEAMLSLLDIDWSWARTGVDDGKMRSLIENSDDFAQFKQAYLLKTTHKTVWDSISKLVLERPIEWKTIEPRLCSIKALRNKCAHFYTVTDDDYSQARELRRQLVQNLTKKSMISTSDINAFAEFSKQLAEAMKILTQSYTESFKTINATTRIIQESVGTVGGGLQAAILEANRSQWSALSSILTTSNESVDSDFDKLADSADDSKKNSDNNLSGADLNDGRSKK